MPEPTIEVIIPVRDMAEHLPKLLRPLYDQMSDGDRVTVVDDASRDDTEAVARSLGAGVVALKDSRGPYYARQVAASRSTADVLLFTDARCRPLPGLLEAHRDLQERPGVALSCTNVRTLSGPRLAARLAASMQPFMLPRGGGAMKATIGMVPPRPDYYPTANLGIDRIAFAKVGGFRSMRGGGDTDICWRIQEQSLGTIATDTRVLMEWEPRTSMRDLASQWKRYGHSNAYMRWVHRNDDVSKGDDSPRRHSPMEAWATLRAELRRPPAELAATALVGLAFQYGYFSAKFKSSQFEMPAYFDVAPNLDSA
ncbi:glycosyltransferase [Mycolicibacterium monacense]|uniref:Glycosyltransferase 2-like domain-containing protein n=3 Tax=Mycobacteriaceae TaxID=1762 RepID=A0AAD1IU01_MYCMB|nr:glycosyltransferase [Mycolicibacterium monacense]MDA4102066.1 glycosyl transferase family A [Mycolicibacterium monacense DSM 44395]OBB74898.1 glycosyl transferase family A [Mycolicibacterium monacense]OBF52456.1 glycosyl transferase family A [Mycolicibacterium monacense]ORB20015.1 glycosyl transferase family A [Mycolicibacterium monacense DSM 44395]QHP86809.1 glycosyltransferase [Mycolicibacterium monacense DSM 44395]